MTEEHIALEKIAVELDEKADDLFGDLDRDVFTEECKPAVIAEAQAYRRAAEIIRYQIECEA